MSRRITLYVFLFFLCVNLAASGGHTDTADGKTYYLVTENLAMNHSFKVSTNSPSINSIQASTGYFTPEELNAENKGIHTAKYVTSSPVLPVIGVPFYILAEAVHISPTALVPFFENSIFLTLTSTVVFLFSSEIYNSKKIGFVLSIFAGVCSFSWPYISTYFEQPSASLMIILSLYFIWLSTKNKFRSSAVLGGIFTGLIALSHVAWLISIPGILVFGVYSFRKGIKKIIQFLLGFCSIISILFYINFTKYHSITNFGYGQYEGISAHLSVDGIYGMFFSPGFGLITNFPLFILFPISIYYLWRKEKTLALIISYIFVVAWLFFGTLQTPIWHGFGGWGPRYMVPAIPIITIALGALLKEGIHKKFVKIIYSGLAFLGFTVNLLGVLVWYQLGYMMGWTVLTRDKIPSSLHVYQYEWGLGYMPALLHLEVLVTQYWDKINPKKMYAYWNACVPDSFIYCNFGLIAITLMLGAVIVLGFLIWRSLTNDSVSVKNQHINKSNEIM